MRAKEFTNFTFDIEPYEGWTGEGVVVHAYDGKDEIGHVIFEPTEYDPTQWYAVDVEVEEQYRRIGIATKMYDMAKQAAKSAGAIIVKSHAQSDDGRGLWGDKKVWEQQVNEYKEYPTREYEGVTFTMKEKDGQLIVKPLNDYGISMGHVVFNMDGKILDPQDLVIADKYQGQGIAKVMYDYIKSQGFTIERSWDQTPAGKGFWDKHRGEDVRIWEDLTTGRNLNTDTEKYVKDHKWKLTTVNPMELDVDSFDDPYNRVIDIDVDHPVNFKDPIILDSNGVIIDGFHRAYQAQRAGLKSIPAYVPVEEQLEESTTSPIVYHGNQGGIHRELITPMWWTEDRDTAVYYATQFNGDGWIYSAKLTCKNPYVVKPTDETNTLVEKYKTLEQQGYDSIYDPRGHDWIPFYSKDIHLVGEPEYQEEINENVNSQILYHATYRPLLKSIKQHGLGGDKAQAKWEDSKPGVVYLATDPDVAESYAESSDVVPEEWLDNIVVLKIDASKLDRSKLMSDRNVLDNSGDTLEYHGVIPVNLIS